MAVLYVRIPDELKRRLDSSAAARRTSLAEDVARLLNEQLAQDLPSQIKTTQLQTSLQLQNWRVKALEGFISMLDVTGAPETLVSQIVRMKAVLASKGTKNYIKRLQAEAKLSDADLGLLQAPPPKRRAEVFDGLLLPADVQALPAHAVSKHERRRWTLKAILARRPRGIKAQLAEAIGTAPAYVSHLLSQPKAKGHRKITDKVARDIERALGLGKCTLDKTEESPTDSLGSAIARLLETVESICPERPSNPRRGRPPRRSSA